MFRRLAKPQQETPQGWIVEVEHPDGLLFYAARLEKPADAEKMVRRSCDARPDREVRALRTAPRTFFQRLGLQPGEIRGPIPLTETAAPASAPESAMAAAVARLREIDWDELLAGGRSRLLAIAATVAAVSAGIASSLAVGCGRLGAAGRAAFERTSDRLSRAASGLRQRSARTAGRGAP